MPNERPLAVEGLLVPLTGPPEQRQGKVNSHLGVTVIFTTVAGTNQALKRAGTLARSLNARITLLVPYIVPYPCPLSSPPVVREFNERRFCVLAAGSSVETTVNIVLCRDRLDALLKLLKPHSLVVIGSRQQWWPSEESRIAKRLRRASHEVICVET